MKFNNRIPGMKGSSIRKVNELVLQYLQILPRCFKDVCIVSPVYGKSPFTCEIVISAKNLLPWAVDHAESIRYSKEELVLMKSFPLWLRGADKSLDRVSYLPAQLQKMIQHDIHKLVHDSKVYCFECDSFVKVNMEKMDEWQGGNTSKWTDVWRCPVAHPLYFEKHEAIYSI